MGLFAYPNIYNNLQSPTKTNQHDKLTKYSNLMAERWYIADDEVEGSFVGSTIIRPNLSTSNLPCLDSYRVLLLSSGVELCWNKNEIINCNLVCAEHQEGFTLRLENREFILLHIHHMWVFLFPTHLSLLL